MKQAFALLAFVIFALLLASCATGVVMTDAEQAACAKQTCSAWTLDELRALVTRAFRAGHEAGYQSGVRSL